MDRDAARPTRRRLLRSSLALAGLGLLSGCGLVPTRSQQPTKVRRIGFLSADQADETTEAFRDEPRELGYEGERDVVVDFRFAGGDRARLPALAVELAALQPAGIVAATVGAAQAAHLAAPALPIVLAGGDAVGTGLIANVARPEGNCTGVTISNAQLTAKRVELLKEAVPTISRLAALSDPNGAIAAAVNREAQRAAAALGLGIRLLGARDAGEVAAALAALRPGGTEGLLVSPGGSITTQRGMIARQAAASGVPAVSEWRDFTVAGGLLAYSTSIRALRRRAATYVDKILKGAEPAELPREFDLVVNLKTAEALGLAIPPSILQQATEVLR